eukprot:3019636-Rhodomonas_salina.6
MELQNVPRHFRHRCRGQHDYHVRAGPILGTGAEKERSSSTISILCSWSARPGSRNTFLLTGMDERAR